MKIIFMGTPSFAAVALEALTESEHEVALVVSQPDSQRGRGKKLQPTPVKEVALKHDISVIQPEKLSSDIEAMNQLKSINPDIIVVAAYGQIVSKEVLEIAKFGCINIHASLLPKYRGAAPIQRVIMEGEKETGITIMQMADGIDTGDMIAKVSTPIERKNFETLHDELAAMGAELLIKTLPEIEAGTATWEKQDDSKSCYAKMLFKSDGKLDFSKDPVELERLIRGYYGAYTLLEGETLKVWAAEALQQQTTATDGTVIKADKDGILVSAGGKLLVLKEIQAAGKKKMSVADYLRGKPIEEGLVLGI